MGPLLNHVPGRCLRQFNSSHELSWARGRFFEFDPNRGYVCLRPGHRSSALSQTESKDVIMPIAPRILITGGMSILMVGLLLGIPVIRARKRAHRAPRYLMAAHLAAIIQGGMLLALTIAVRFSQISDTLETVLASALVAGVALFDVGLVVNWLRGIEDGFAENALGSTISGIGIPLVLIGAGILFFGVLSAL